MSHRPGTTEPVLSGPARVEDALVIQLGPTDGMRDHDGPRSGMALVRAYVATHEGARLTPVPRAPRRREPRRGGGDVMRGWVTTPDSPPTALHLKLASARDAAALRAELSASRGVVNVYHPPVQYPVDAPPTAPSATGGTCDQWGLERCGFPFVWEELDGDDGPAIALIDQGWDTGHPEVAGRIEQAAVRRGGPESPSVHATAVASVICARRDDRTGISGCCSAKVRLYNVWAPGSFDPLAYYEALADVATSGLRVLNLSLASSLEDPLVKDGIRRCIDNGVVVVAAMGNCGGQGAWYPATYDGVVAVGATNRADERASFSSYGPQICLSAPGEYIYTAGVPGDLPRSCGTSYAVPMVSAAVWMVLRQHPGWTVLQVKDFLARCTTGGGWSPELGWGRLDMLKLRDELNGLAGATAA